MQARNIVLGLFLAAIMISVSFMSNASQHSEADYMPDLNYLNITCATLGYNAGYDELGLKFANRLEAQYEIPEYKAEIIKYSLRIVGELGEHAMLQQDGEGTMKQSAEFFFKIYCQEA